MYSKTNKKASAISLHSIISAQKGADKTNKNSIAHHIIVVFFCRILPNLKISYKHLAKIGHISKSTPKFTLFHNGVKKS